MFKSYEVAIIGASGQLGSEFRRLFDGRAIEIRHDQIEITDPASVHAVLSATVPSIVINAAAYNWVDKAEYEPDVAFAVNALGPRTLALACAGREIPLLHVSSDYVFGLDARDAPYSETDTPGPLNAYGLSKLAGEYFVRSLCPQHYVVRTCGLYGHAEAVGKGNFVKTILRLGRERGHVRVVNDQYCTPTSAADLAEALVDLIQTESFGLYHLTNRGQTTWYDFTREIFEIANVNATIEAISTAEFGAKARRPANSLLNCDKAAGVLHGHMPPWHDAVARYLSSLNG